MIPGSTIEVTITQSPHLIVTGKVRGHVGSARVFLDQDTYVLVFLHTHKRGGFGAYNLTVEWPKQMGFTAKKTQRAWEMLVVKAAEQKIQEHMDNRDWRDREREREEEEEHIRRNANPPEPEFDDEEPLDEGPDEEPDEEPDDFSSGSRGKFGDDFDAFDDFFQNLFGGRNANGGDRIRKLPWNVIGLESPATRDTAKAAYRAASIKAHPDRGGSHEKMVRVNQAWVKIQEVMGWK